MDKETSRKLIIDNYVNPKNRNKNHEGYTKVNTRNESCIDNIDIYIKWKDDILEDITFSGEACAISISSTSIMIKNLIGKTKEEALAYIKEFYKMTDGNPYNQDILKDAACFEEVSRQGNRKVCANLPLKGIEKAILEKI